MLGEICIELWKLSLLGILCVLIDIKKEMDCQNVKNDQDTDPNISTGYSITPSEGEMILSWRSVRHDFVQFLEFCLGLCGHINILVVPA